MCMCVPFVSLYDSLLVIIFMLFKNIVILHSFFENILEKLTSRDVNNLTYLDGYCLFSVCELKEDSQFTVLWFYKNKDRFSLFVLLHSAQSRLILCCGMCIT